MPTDRTLRVEGLVNARDLGGMPLIGGGTTPSGVLARSESPGRVTRAGWAALASHGVRTVVDLRQPPERQQHPTSPPPGVRVVAVDHDGLAEHPGFWADHWDTGLVSTPLYYLPHLDPLPERTVAVLSAIAAAPAGGVLFHCAGGRDRTGIIAAVLLTVAGVEPDAIVDDYLETLRNAPALAAARARPDEEAELEALLADRGTTSADAFAAFLDGLDADGLLARLPADES